jgi:hypothetical protein
MLKPRMLETGQAQTATVETIYPKLVGGQSTDGDSSVATSAFLRTNDLRSFRMTAEFLLPNTTDLEIRSHPATS